MLNVVFFRQRALLISAAAAVIVFILWNVHALDFVLYPLRLFVTFVHETGHGVTAILTGGQFNRFVVDAGGSGFAVTSGGSRALIIPAGYIGAALFGALLFYLVNTVPFPKTLALILALFVGGITLLFTGLLSTAFLVGMGFALVLVALWRFADRGVVMLVLEVLAIVTGLNAVLDLLFLINNSNVTLGTMHNDAAAFSVEIAPLIPPVGWALLWCAIAIGLLAVSVFLGVIRRISPI